MRITTPTTSPTRSAADMLAVGVTRPVELGGAARSLDEALGGRISALVDAGEIRGGRGQLTVLHTAGEGVRARRVALVGLGRAASAGPEDVRAAAGAVARAAQGARARALAFALDGLPVDRAAGTRAVVEGAVLGSYTFDRYRTGDADERRPPLASLAVLGGDRAAAARAALVADAVNRARDLQNTPASDLGPEELAERARAIAGESAHVSAAVRDAAWMRRKGMGAFLAVANASSRPPRLIELRYRPPGRRAEAVLGLVGKGITFDSGGLSLKPARSMTGMKYDMSGAAAVLEATAAIAALELPIEVVAVAGATENMPDTSSFRPDDVIRAANGKTIEVTNTDAEGRLVLADCLHRARELGATHVIDLATLTGAVRVALGDYHAGLFARDQAFADRVVEAGERAGEHVWQLPLHDTFRRMMRSEVADLMNSSTAGLGGACFAARFLQEFAGEGDWAHVDIAGTAALDRSRGDEFGKGATGFGVRLLVEVAESLC